MLFRNKEKDSKPRRQSLSANRFSLSKRRRFILVSLLLTTGLFFVQRLPNESRMLAFGLFGMTSYLLCSWSLLRDLRGIAWVTNLTLPTMYPVAVGLFYFLLPQHELTRLVVALLFAVSMYALLLTSNIFAVASIRTIQLLRAARAVGFLLTILTSAFLFHFVFSLRIGVGYIAVSSFLISFFLFLFGTWTYSLGEKLTGKELSYTLIGSVVLTQAAVAISFWLIDVSLVSIFLSMIMYVVLGLMQHELEDRLFVRTLQEYLGFGAIVFLIITAVVFFRWIS